MLSVFCISSYSYAFDIDEKNSKPRPVGQPVEIGGKQEAAEIKEATEFSAKVKDKLDKGEISKEVAQQKVKEYNEKIINKQEEKNLSHQDKVGSHKEKFEQREVPMEKAQQLTEKAYELAEKAGFKQEQVAAKLEQSQAKKDFAIDKMYEKQEQYLQLKRDGLSDQAICEKMGGGSGCAEMISGGEYHQPSTH